MRAAILDVLEASYIPRLREHLAMRVTGTPSTNERFYWAPEGNPYGPALTPRNDSVPQQPYRSSVENH